MNITVINHIRKAIVAAFGAAVAAYFAGGGRLTTATEIQVVGSFLVVGVLTYLVPNATADTTATKV